MSTYTQVVITCDGAHFGPPCDSEYATLRGATEGRRFLRGRGWIKRLYQRSVVDLCPACAPRMDHIPKEAWSPGRPRKVRHPDSCWCGGTGRRFGGPCNMSSTEVTP